MGGKGHGEGRLEDQAMVPTLGRGHCLLESLEEGSLFRGGSGNRKGAGVSGGRIHWWGGERNGV